MDFEPIIARIKGFFCRKKSSKIDLKSRKFLNQVRIVLEALRYEKDTLGNISWHYQSLEKANLTEPEAIVTEYILIQRKKSKCPLRERELITGIIGMAVMKFVKK